ncbi:GntR family transcriptional regulator [Aestuariicoccus sp. MJ-SS9]|uniref:GntR family transcriptional regulator n=1 Tax=Aestuariicoccus sp. MJ-SS9 TaxID=3079855 RepID=UPI00290BA32F|nr:GntR family transcriptional regulator [Aestuariicoccus sp. MJ-SS9]MDU8909822.1 GntR family transcriptional regulator [Aestuariicoccus sp. MJ-SS9]
MADTTLPDQIAARLRRDILRGRLAPGAPVKERDNAAEMGVSRTPMREAIRILAKEGLVELRPARSPVVANPTLKEVTDAITVLVALEELSGRLAVEHATDEEIAGIRRIHEKMAAEFDLLDHIDRFEIDMAFHIAIAKASHNVALARTHGAYLARMWRARFLSARTRRNRDRVLRQHGTIVAGLEARDAEAVSREIGVHLGHLLTHIIEEFRDRAEDARPAVEVESDSGS